MQSLARLGVLGIFALTASYADAATMTGTVTGPDGTGFRAAFVRASPAGLHMTVSVLSDNEGRYTIENLPAGDYRVQIRAIGYKADTQRGVKLTDDQKAAFDFALQTTPVRWS